MRGRLRGISGHTADRLAAGWELAACAPGAIGGPEALDRSTLDWIQCAEPMTAAAALRAAGRWSLDGPPRRFDAEDWWYRARFPAEPAEPGGRLMKTVSSMLAWRNAVGTSICMSS